MNNYPFCNFSNEDFREEKFLTVSAGEKIYFGKKPENFHFLPSSSSTKHLVGISGPIFLTTLFNKNERVLIYLI